MSTPEDTSFPEAGNRWYDQDPALQRALEQLRNAPDNYQAQVALNIIKIIVEHQMEEATDIEAERLSLVLPQQTAHRRWYDVHETLSSAIHLLSDCPPDLQSRLIPSIAQMIESTLIQQP